MGERLSNNKFQSTNLGKMKKPGYQKKGYPKKTALTEKEELVHKLRSEGMTFVDIAKKMGFSMQRARDLYEAASIFLEKEGIK